MQADHLNTPRAILGAANALVWKWDSDAFGTTAANENPSALGAFNYNLRFPGQYYDKETANHYNYFRDNYNPKIGRYMQSDPIGLYGGSLSTYAYVKGNPVKYVDPRGLDIMVITGGVRDGSPNIFGHVGTAVEGYGMASYGNSTPLGSSVADYLTSQGAVRNQQVTIIPTSALQDALAINFINQHPNKNDVGTLDNCAVRTNQLLNSAGVPTQGIPFPGGTARDVQSLPGATTYFIPQNGPIPPGLLNVLGKFAP